MQRKRNAWAGCIKTGTIGVGWVFRVQTASCQCRNRWIGIILIIMFESEIIKRPASRYYDVTSSHRGFLTNQQKLSDPRRQPEQTRNQITRLRKPAPPPHAAAGDATPLIRSPQPISVTFAVVRFLIPFIGYNFDNTHRQNNSGQPVE